MVRPPLSWVVGGAVLVVVLCAAAAYGAYLWERARAMQVEDSLRATISSLEATHGNSGGQVPSNTTSSTSPCDLASLKLTQAAASGAAGTMGITYAVTNTSSRACTIGGYPNVTLADGVGQQIGQPAVASSSASSGTVTVQPNAAAYVTVLFPNSDNFAPGVCSSQMATMLRLTPSGQTQALTTSVDNQPYCPGFATQAFTATGP